MDRRSGPTTDGQVLDLTDWSLFFSDQPGYGIGKVEEAAARPETRWVVVRDAHLQRSRPLGELAPATGRRPRAGGRFPEHPAPGSVAGRRLRPRPPPAAVHARPGLWTETTSGAVTAGEHAIRNRPHRIDSFEPFRPLPHRRSDRSRRPAGSSPGRPARDARARGGRRDRGDHGRGRGSSTRSASSWDFSDRAAPRQGDRAVTCSALATAWPSTAWSRA